MEQNKPVIHVIKPGLFTTVQDLGRTGFQQYGMVVSGAMDAFALRVGNLLVGNDEGNAGLEITLLGPTLRFLDDAIIAVTGGDLSPALDGQPLPMWKSVYVKKDAELRFGSAKKGCRAYLSIHGGINVPIVMGSRSTYVKARIGGFQGRALQIDDVLCAGSGVDDKLLRQFANRILSPEFIPSYSRGIESTSIDSTTIEVRVLPGPQQHMIEPSSVNTFYETPYIVTPQSDRMGYRLQGAKLQHRGSADIITDAVAHGSIQVPASGDPILLLADRQTTGGYPKIATVISVDLPLVGQAKPGDQIRFCETSLTEAHKLLAAQESLVKQIKQANKPL